MTAQTTNVAIGAETTLSSALSSGATTVNVTSTASFPTVPFYVVVDPDNDAKREVILVDGSTTATTFVLSAATSRGLDGTTDVGHDSGAKVACVPVPGLWTDINDRVDALSAAAYQSGGTDVAVADGGTGASTAAGARTNLGALGTAEHDAHDHSVAMSTVVLDDISNVDLTGIAAGSTLYFNGTNIVDLGIGAAGQVLTVNAGATAPEWTDASGGTQIEAGTYTGDGAASKDVALTMSSPKLVFIVNETDSVADGAGDGQFSFFVSPLGGGVVDAGFLISGSVLVGKSLRDITLGTAKFTVTQNTNLSGKTYRYVAFGTA